MKEKYSWEKVFDSVKDKYPEECVVTICSKDKYAYPFTPRNLKGYANVYAKYDKESDSIFIWAYTGLTEDGYDEEDGDWGRWSMKEKIQGRRGRDGIWIEKLCFSWEAECVINEKI